MAKVKSAFFCQNCGHETPKWLGKCPSCNEWNTFVEELVQKQVPQVVAFSKSGESAKPQALNEIEQREHAGSVERIINHSKRKRGETKKVLQSCRLPVGQQRS